MPLDWPQACRAWTTFCPAGENCKMGGAHQEYRYSLDGAKSKMTHHLFNSPFHGENDYRFSTWADCKAAADDLDYVIMYWDNDSDSAAWLKEHEYVNKYGELPSAFPSPPQLKAQTKAQPLPRAAGPRQPSRSPPPRLRRSRSRSRGALTLRARFNPGIAAGSLGPRQGYAPTGDSTIDFHRQCKVLLDAAAAISSAARASAQVAETAARGWRAESQSMDMVMREVRYISDQFERGSL